jgi:hypothetical protein
MSTAVLKFCNFQFQQYPHVLHNLNVIVTIDWHGRFPEVGFDSCPERVADECTFHFKGCIVLPLNKKLKN